ncbi:MAG: hypothetical protein GY861_03075 [bacterium]|nr:hypothetical protein [bacterium]
MITEIHRKLEGAIAVICIQKNPGTDVGLGGYMTLDKPRLALAIKPGIIKIVKAKNFKEGKNPNGLQIKYKLHSGCAFSSDGGWHIEQKG